MSGVIERFKMCKNEAAGSVFSITHLHKISTCTYFSEGDENEV